MWRCGILVALVLMLAAGGAANGRAPTSGIRGRVVAGPICPVESVPPQPSCAPRPLAATLRIHRVGRRAPVTSVRSGADGRYRVRLPAATYVVRALPTDDSSLPRPPPARRVRVHAGHFTFVTITYDTGIR